MNVKRLYIFGMSKNLKSIRNQLTGQSGGIVTHLMKLYKYPDSSAVNHWRGEIFGFIHSISTVKGKNSYPSSDWLFNTIWDNIDYNDIGCWEVGMNKQYGLGIAIKSVIFYELCQNYIRWLSNMLSEYGQVSRQQVYDKLKELGL